MKKVQQYHCPIYIETQDGHLEEIRKIELQKNQILGAAEPARIVFKNARLYMQVNIVPRDNGGLMRKNLV